MIPTKDSDTVLDTNEIENSTAVETQFDSSRNKSLRNSITKQLSRQTYQGSLVFNFCAFLLPALYGTLSKLWVAEIDSSQVVTTDIYTYIGVVVEVLNDGLPRAAYLIIGDRSTRTLRSRLGLSYTLIIFQLTLGAVMTVVFVAASEHLAAAFVPEQVRQSSLTYVRISSVLALSSTMEVAVSSCTRALDHPDVPLVISSTKFLVNILLDMLVVSKFHIGSFTPTLNAQAIVRLVCDMTSSICGLGYFIYVSFKMRRQSKVEGSVESIAPSLRALKVLVRPSVYTFVESALRNALYLWLVAGIISMSADYATAWGIFNTIRWGLVMVPVQTLQASTLTFVGHNWGQWRSQTGADRRRPKATKKDIYNITRPAFLSTIISLIVEIPICIFLSLWGIEGFAYYLSLSSPVAQITQKMWKTIDWCYIFYALAYQLSAILLATSPRWYLYQALGSNLLWVLPWAITVSKIHINAGNAWKYHSVIFGGSLVFDFFVVIPVLGFWARGLIRGKIRTQPVQGSIS